MSGICTWSDLSDIEWLTSCGHRYKFHEGSLDESKFEFCPWCGRDLAELPPDPYADEYENEDRDSECGDH